MLGPSEGFTTERKGETRDRSVMAQVNAAHEIPDGEEGGEVHSPLQEELQPSHENGIDPMEASYTYDGQPYMATTRRSRAKGFVGQPPSSLAALATGKKYLADPLTPLTPRPNVSLCNLPLVSGHLGFFSCAMKFNECIILHFFQQIPLHSSRAAQRLRKLCSGRERGSQTVPHAGENTVSIQEFWIIRCRLCASSAVAFLDVADLEVDSPDLVNFFVFPNSVL